MEFPCHLYKVPGPHGSGIKYRYIGCADQEAFEALTALGWRPTVEDAVALNEPDPTGDTPRAELEREANELGVKFDGRTNDRKLAEKIAAARDEKI